MTVFLNYAVVGVSERRAEGVSRLLLLPAHLLVARGSAASLAV